MNYNEFTLRLYKVPDDQYSRKVYALTTISPYSDILLEKYREASRTFPEDPNKRVVAWWESLEEEEKASLALEFPLGSLNTEIDPENLVRSNDFIQVMRAPEFKR
ncbi:hypothetical protein [Larkinella soli]|uniref:hypothetical protein n=1 Tax=Larkinella soli TaxID=1770527 RepID=UPI0013E3FF3D|nr:hypothetical protein [Larkinella soli]